jgi:hypothetical protein
MNNETKLQQLFHVLRLCGAAMIVAAAGTFLVQSWDGTGDVARYFALLGATALLPAVAYVCGVRFQESRSARVLVLTFLALVPIHAGVLGGFVLSQFGAPTTALGSVPQWVAPSPLSAIALVAGAAVVLVPLTWGAFRVLARPHAALLTAVNAGSNALLLIPDRSVRAATFAVVPVLAAAAWCAWRTKPATREARLALGFLLAPAAVITARQVLFYDVSSAFWAAILAACAIGLFVMGRKSGDATVERVAFVPTAFAVAAIVFDSSLLRQVPLSTQWLLYGWTTGLACIGFALASQRSKGFFVGAAVALNAFTAASTLVWAPRPLAALQAIAVGLALMSYGFVSGRKRALYPGIALGGFGFIVEVAHAIETFEPSGWLALAGSGAVLVALTAWLERRARVVRLAEAAAKVSEPEAIGLS